MSEITDKQNTPVSGSDAPTCSPYVLHVTDAHGEIHTFGPIDLPDEIQDQGETWDNIAAMETEAESYVRYSIECALYVPSVHDESLENDLRELPPPSNSASDQDVIGG